MIIIDSFTHTLAGAASICSRVCNEAFFFFFLYLPKFNFYILHDILVHTFWRLRWTCMRWFILLLYDCLHWIAFNIISWMVCSRDFYVAKIDEFLGNLVDLFHYVASIHTLSHRFHVDNSVGWVAESVKIIPREPICIYQYIAMDNCLLPHHKIHNTIYLNCPIPYNTCTVIKRKATKFSIPRKRNCERVPFPSVHSYMNRFYPKCIQKHLHVSYHPDKYSRNSRSPFHRSNSRMVAHGQRSKSPTGLLQKTIRPISWKICPETRWTINNQMWERTE